MNQENRCRKISPFEWLYLSMRKGFAPCAVQLRIVADTLPSQAALEAALARAAQANPAARFVPRGGWWMDSGKSPRVRCLTGAETPSLSHPAFRESFEFGEWPAIEVLSWQGAGLVFRCSHALMDAGGLIFFAEETFRALRGEPLRGTTVETSTRDHLLTLRHPTRRAWHKPDQVSPIGAPLAGESGFLWETRAVPGQVSAIGARVASSLSALAARRRPGATTRMMTPVDLRHVDPAWRCPSNFSTAFFFDAPPSASWQDFYGWTLEAFARHDERATSPVDALFPWLPRRALSRFHQWAHARQVRTDRVLFSGMLSHIGQVSLSAFSAEGFAPTSASFLPFDVPGSAIGIITMQHDHGVEIAASCPAATGSDGRLAVALDRLCADLEAGRYRPVARPASPTGYVPEDGPRMDLPIDGTILPLLAAQADAFPDRSALSDAQRRVSYAELEQRVRRCAALLQSREVAAGANVAIMAGRSIEALVGMLAILRIGAAFVPIDIEWPQERIRFVLDDCRPACILMEDRFEPWAAAFPALRFSDLEGAGPIACRDAAPVSSRSVAYVFYTSGSTGRPKGVVVTHRSLLNYVQWARVAYLERLSAPMVCPFFTSMSFDLTLTALFVPLTTGGEIRVFPQPEPLAAIQAIVDDVAINAVKLTPSHLRLFAEVGVGASGIRTYIASGEALPTAPARDVVTQSRGGAEVFNEYGPTEATIGCVVHRFDPDRDLAAFVPIGRPIANTEVLLLDDDLRSVPDGEVGEVFLSGECLAAGYLARPDEDVRFRPHPFRAGERVYRTGDRALRLPDGNFDYRGRLDGQVKIRGHRIEIGEVESAIAASGLCRAGTVVQEHAGTEVRLVAFVVWRDGVGEPDLRAALASILPAYMLPSRIVGLDDMPLNVNGKIDRSRLPIDRSAPPAKAPDDAVPDGLERALTAMVADLSAEAPPSVSPGRSLLESGLDSLQMMLLLARVSKRFFPALSPNPLLSQTGAFLREPTVRGLAAHLRRLGVDERDARVDPAPPSRPLGGRLDAGAL